MRGIYYFDREERKGEDYEKVDENDFLYCRLCFPAGTGMSVKAADNVEINAEVRQIRLIYPV